MRRILDAQYEKADLNNVTTEQCQHINSTERYILLNILKKSKDMFDGTLGTWNTTPVDLELKHLKPPVNLSLHESCILSLVYIIQV